MIGYSYGYRGKPIVAAQGVFVCPNCNAERQYAYINIVRYFIFLGIQLFPLDSMETYVECQTCHGKFKPGEIVNTPGNQKYGAEIAAQKKDIDRRTELVHGRNIAFTGLVFVLLAIVGWICATGLSSSPGGLCNFIFPILFFMGGLGLIFVGINIRRKATETPITSAPMG